MGGVTSFRVMVKVVDSVFPLPSLAVIVMSWAVLCPLITVPETGDCVLATINSENKFVKYQQTYSGEVSQVVSIYKIDSSDSDTTVITNSGHIIATDIFSDGEPLFYKAIRTPVLEHDIYLNGVKCHQDNYFVY